MIWFLWYWECKGDIDKKKIIVKLFVKWNIRIYLNLFKIMVSFYVSLMYYILEWYINLSEF